MRKYADINHRNFYLEKRQLSHIRGLKDVLPTTATYALSLSKQESERVVMLPDSHLNTFVSLPSSIVKFGIETAYHDYTPDSSHMR